MASASEPSTLLSHIKGNLDETTYEGFLRVLSLLLVLIVLGLAQSCLSSTRSGVYNVLNLY